MSDSPRGPKTKKVRIDAAATGGPVNANECITFHLLKLVDGKIAMEEDGHFPPEMSHQLFGEDEEIKGWDGLEIDVFFSPRFNTFIDVKCTGRAPGCTDLKEPFTLAFPAGFSETKEAFDGVIESEAALNPANLGTVMTSAETVEGTKFMVLKSTLSTASQEIKDLHARLQPLLYFFVDAASAIDAEDPAWDLLLAVETSPSGTDVVGFATTYSFYVFPDRKRIRLSQILVLPSHQGRGVGSLLMQSVYDMADEMNAVDITFEDPTDDLQRMRDRRDLKRMLIHDWLTKEVEQRLNATASLKGKEQADTNSTGTETVSTAASILDATPELFTKIQTELRMSKQQTRRMWETLLFGHAAASKPEAIGAVEDYVRARIQGLVAGAKKSTKNKKVRDTESGFVMCRVPDQQGKAPSAIPSMPVEQCTAEQQQDAIEEAVAHRLDELQQVLQTAAE